MKILILGGGFAGLEAAIKLTKKGYKDITLISDRDYMFVYPVSIWIPVGKRSFDDTKLSLHKLARKHGFQLVIDKIEKIEARNKLLHSANSQYRFDYLFLAMGMGKVVQKGLEYTHSICGKPDEALTIKNELDKLIERGHGNINVGFGGNPKDPTGTVVRGGPAFELLFNISVLLKEKKLTDKFKLTFFAPMEKPGARMGEKAYGKMGAFFKHYRVSTYFGKKIKMFTADSIVFEDDSVLESDLTLYISGGSGLDIITTSDLPVNETGFVEIDETCQVTDFETIYAIGDAAALKSYPWSAKQGHVAEIMADVAVSNFDNIQKGIETRISYWNKLHIICVMDSGDGAAIVMRGEKKEFILPLPIVGHWLKKAWGWYYKNSKMKRMFRIPGM